MSGIPYGWIAWSAANAAVSTATANGFDVAQAAGLGPVTAGAVTLALTTRALMDINALYGSVAAVLAPALVTVTDVLSDGHSTAPAAASVALFVLTRSARKVSR